MMETTVAQIMNLEEQISAIESANINKETFAAMQSAVKAQKEIHAGLTVDKVDSIMYVVLRCLTSCPLREHHILTIWCL